MVNLLMTSPAYNKLLYPNTDILKNKFNVKDDYLLKRLEEIAVTFRMIEILNDKSNIIKSFDMKHIKSIHKYLLQDVYTWAGTLKVTSLYKAQDVLNGASVHYCPREFLEDNMNSVFLKMKKTNWNDLSVKDKVLKFADLYQEIWQCHPFNDGNTRTTTIFMMQFAKSVGIPVDFNMLFSDPITLRNSFVLYSVNFEGDKMNKLFLESIIK